MANELLYRKISHCLVHSLLYLLLLKSFAAFFTVEPIIFWKYGSSYGNIIKLKSNARWQNRIYGWSLLAAKQDIQMKKGVHIIPVSALKP